MPTQGMSTNMAPIDRARKSLEGLSIGDAFGERFFGDPKIALDRIDARNLDSPAPWRWTDDTAMAKAIVNDLEQHGTVNAERLAAALKATYDQEPWRGYGAGAHLFFEQLMTGASWLGASSALFDGSGSFGNGAAMRVAPVGAYFADDLKKAANAAEESAKVTHAHPDGQAGAIAVAVAAAVAWQMRNASVNDLDDRLFKEVLALTPESPTREGIVRAAALPRTCSLDTAVLELGNGQYISSQDTVPLCLWCVARHPQNYEEALWTTVGALGDRDTTCAIVGGVVVMSAAAETIPQAWIEAREPLAGIKLSQQPL